MICDYILRNGLKQSLFSSTSQLVRLGGPRLETVAHFGAMTSVPLPLQLEPQWEEIVVGQRVDVLADVVYIGLGKNVIRSAIHNRLLVVYGNLPSVAALSLLNAVVTQVGQDIRLALDHDTILLPHSIPNDAMFQHVIETCTGVGCLGVGLQSAGMHIKVQNDISGPLCAFLERQGQKTVVPGDIGSPQTLQAIHALSGGSCMFTAGFSCQPWSLLGDQKRTADARSRTFQSVLRGAFFLRSHSIMLECVCAAGADPVVQATLKAFCTQTGFKLTQTNLHLDRIVPAKRDRWWCILTSRVVPAFALHDLPSLPVPPVVSDMLSAPMILASHELKQLELDMYETGKFEQCGGLLSNLVRADAPLRTVLHAYGSQLTACPCHCRMFPLSEQRLVEKGLFGALFTLPGTFVNSRWELPRTRHIHPQEVALLHGMLVGLQWGPQLKLSLSGLGQLASPVQSCWISGFFLQQIDKMMDRPQMSPAYRLSLHFSRFFQDVQNAMPNVASSPNFQGYTTQVWQTLRIADQDFAGPSFGHVHMPDLLEEKTSRSGRKDLESQEKSKQPADETQGLIEEQFKQPATGPQEPKEEPSASTFHNVPPEPVHAMPGFQHLGPSHDSTLPSHSSALIATRSDLPDLAAAPCRTEAVVQHEDHDSEMPSFSGDFGAAHDGMSIDTPRNEPSPKPSSAFAADPVHGGLNAFACHKPEPLNLLKLPAPEYETAPFARSTGVCDDTQIDAGQSPSSPGSFTQSLAQAVMEAEVNEVDVDEPTNRHWIQVIRPGDKHPGLVQVSASSTVGAILQAEVRLGAVTNLFRVNDAVGCMISDQDLTSPFQQLFLQPLDSIASPGVKPQVFSEEGPLPRVQLLHQQEAWVAEDEFCHYLHMLAHTGQATFQSPCMLPPHFMDEELQVLLQRWADQCCQLLTHHTRVLSAIYVRSHWFPVLFLTTPFGLKVCCTPEGTDWMTIALHHMPQVGMSELNAFSQFHNDCGFQAIAWLTHTMYMDAMPTEPAWVNNAACKPFSAKDATAWRYLFEHHLHATGLANQPTVPNHLRLGGAGSGDLTAQLRELLKDHGVPEDQSASRADHVLSALGRGRTIQLLRGPQPWKDLKAAANACSPRLQLVMATELNHAIQKRLTDNKPFGQAKIRKKGQFDKPHMQPVQLNPEDLEVPEGIFCENDNVALRQIPCTAIGPDARGVVVASAQSAATYLKLSLPITDHGPALLIVNPHDPLLHGVGEIIRFPAKCLQTDEPILLTAKLVQLGKLLVTRNTNSKAPKIEEVPNDVLKICVYRDELDMPWETFLSQPVKHVLQALPPLQTPDCILDCWDRQHLSLKLSRTKPRDSEVYSFCIRVTQVQLERALELSGEDAIYVEPRTADGKKPDDTYRIIWLNKLAKPMAQLAKQTTKNWVSLFRSGPRFGLRVRASEASEVHKVHKPNSVFLDNSEILHFTAGPFPYGATRATISKAFSTWQWPARPVQPKGRSYDGLGVIWEVQATARPPFNVFQLDHSDVLISEVDKKARRGDTLGPAIQASEKTLAALRKPAPLPQQASASTDPWDGKPEANRAI